MFLNLFVEIALIILKGMIIISVAVLPAVTQLAQPAARAAQVSQAAQPKQLIVPVSQAAQASQAAPVSQSAPVAATVPAAQVAPLVEQVVVPVAPAAASTAQPVAAVAPVNPALVVISPEALPDGVLGVPYSQNITVSGGTPPYTVTVDPAILPNGLTWTEIENGKYTVSGSAPTEGLVTFKITATDSAAAPATTVKTYPFEIKGAGAAPVIYTIVTGTPGNGDWYTSNVDIHWVIQEDKTYTTKGCEDISVLADTDESGQSLTCTATSADGETSVTIAIKRDVTAPINVIGTADRDPIDGWYNAPVTITFEGEDPLPGSGIDSCESILYKGPDGLNILITGYCFDVAGNRSEPSPYIINYNTAGPDLTVTFAREADHGGWYNAPVDIGLEAVAAGIGVDLTTCKMTITVAEAAGPVVVYGTRYTYAGPDSSAEIKVAGECSDLSGSVVPSEEALFKYDNTAPADVSGAPVRAADNHGSDDLDWYNAAVEVKFTGMDPLPGSGLDACTSVLYDGPDGFNVSVPGKCWDVAGNESGEAASSAFNFDNTDPTMDPLVSGGQPVYLHQEWSTIMNASDETSGVDMTRSSCDNLDTSSVGLKTASCRVFDNAGNGPVTGSAAYIVIYKFTGFFRPAGESWNEENAGRVLPIKWHLADYYDVEQDGAVVSFTVKPVSCDAEGLEPFAAPANIAADMQPQQHGSYHYNWKTDKDQTGCAQVFIDLGEGLSDTVFPEYSHYLNVMWK